MPDYTDRPHNPEKNYKQSKADTSITELATDTNTQTHESRINQEAVLDTKEHV